MFPWKRKTECLREGTIVATQDISAVCSNECYSSDEQAGVELWNLDVSQADSFKAEASDTYYR